MLKSSQTVSTQAPFSPVNLLQAGVPAREVIWFRHLTPNRQMAALNTTRGKLLLETVRKFVGQARTASAVAA